MDSLLAGCRILTFCGAELATYERILGRYSLAFRHANFGYAGFRTISGNALNKST